VTYYAWCPECRYASQDFRTEIAAEVVAEDHHIKTGHDCKAQPYVDMVSGKL
jgi:hypothetical protein